MPSYQAIPDCIDIPAQNEALIQRKMKMAVLPKENSTNLLHIYAYISKETIFPPKYKRKPFHIHQMTAHKNSKDMLLLQTRPEDGQLYWSKSPQGHSGYYNWEKMMGLGFEEDQQNSLDILIKFQHDHQHPESHTHEELFLPLTEISVTSHHHDPHPQQQRQDRGQVEQLMRKMRMACEEQEGKICEVLSGADSRKGGVKMSLGRSSQRIPEEEDVPGKRKIIRKRQTF